MNRKVVIGVLMMDTYTHTHTHIRSETHTHGHAHTRHWCDHDGDVEDSIVNGVISSRALD